jgi:hypothetical protein
MDWTKVFIPQNKDSDKIAADLVARISLLNHQAGVPGGAAIYGVRIPTVGHVYYIGPETSRVAAKAIAEQAEVTLVDAPSLKLLKRFEL